MAHPTKHSKVDEFLTYLQESPHFILIKYGKTSHGALEKLRRELKKSDARLKVVKNSLFEIALRKHALKEKALATIKEQAFPLKDTTAVISLSEDFISGLKAFFTFTKTEPDLGFKTGFIDHEMYNPQSLERLAQLPSRTELLGKILGSLQSPSTRLVYSMKHGISKLTYVLKARSTVIS